HDHILNPITALEFYQSPDGPLLLLAGEGSFLKIFEAENSKLLGQCKVFDGQAIHGIIAAKNAQDDDVHILIWGGSFLTLLRTHDFEQILAQSLTRIAVAAAEASDWILDAALSPLVPGCCFLITAHNTVVRATLDKTSSFIEFETVASPSRSILYSAHILAEPSGEILVAAGTVFGEIIIWSCSSSGTTQVLFTFTGHEGSIFGVNISPPLTLACKRRGRLLASCSDDRTIRVWDLTTDSPTRTVNDQVGLVRETGFGPNSDDQAQSENRCIATVMAHASRIWRVKFLVDQGCLSPSLVSLLSFGEDSSTQQWSLNIDSCTASNPKADHTSETLRLMHVSTFAFHSGKHIWSTALHYCNPLAAILATGGADGKISSRAVSLLEEESSRASCHDELGPSYGISSPGNTDVQCNSWDLEEDILKHLSLIPSVDESIIKGLDSEAIEIKKPKKIVKDAFNKYDFISENQLLLTTTFGRVLLSKIGVSHQWEELELPKTAEYDLKSYSVVQGIPECGLAYIAGANGKIYCYVGGAILLEAGNVNGKVADMFKIFNPATKGFELLVTTLGTGMATLFSIGSTATGLIHLFATFTLPPKFMVTIAGRIDDLLVLGSRTGSLAVLDREDRAVLHGVGRGMTSTQDAITTIIPLPHQASENSMASYFLTTGRDGVYSIFAIDKSDNGAIRCVHVGSLPFGPIVEAAWLDGAELLLYGFKGKNFIVWNETKQLEVMSVECGGAHRSYAYSPLRKSSGGHFAYSKASKLYIYSQQAPSHTIVKRSGHGREIKACAVSPNGEYVATGAEDTAIRIWSYDDDGKPLEHRLHCHAIMQNHSAGIQHLQWHGLNYLFSSGGNEEFFLWSIERIPGFGLGVVCEAACPDQSADRDLRIMSLDVSDVDGDNLLVSLAYSDSTMRTYTYSKQNRFCLVAKGIYTSSCLTQIRHLRVSPKEVHIITAATDGNISLWRIDLSPPKTICGSSPSEFTFLGTRKIHQNTIKSLDFVKYTDAFLVVTGGDDNALGVSIYSINQLPSEAAVTKPLSYILRSAHAAAITGLCIVPIDEVSPSMDIVKIVSSSNDQRIKEWHVQLSTSTAGDLSIVNIQNPSDEFTSVADIGDVVFLRARNNHVHESQEQKVLIVGNGMEIWKLPGCSR
ncbi:WD40 repeat-like protein, partial [Mollisia scopiformis]